MPEGCGAIPEAGLAKRLLCPEAAGAVEGVSEGLGVPKANVGADEAGAAEGAAG